MDRRSAVTLSAVSLLVLVSLAPGCGESPPQGGPPTAAASTSTTAASTSTSAAGATSTTVAAILRGTLVVVSKDSPSADEQTVKYGFAATTAGDFLLTGVNEVAGEGRVEQISFSAAQGAERSYLKIGSEGGEAYERRGLAAGSPDTPLGDQLVGREHGSVVRALLAGGDSRVETATYAGRPCYRLDLPVEPDRLSTYSPDRMTITVDQETGYPLHILESYQGSLVRETRLDEVNVAGSYSLGDFWLPLPPDVAVTPNDLGFDPVDATELARAAGYQPVLPLNLPQGFALDRLSVAPTGQPTGKEGMNPPGAGVVSATYRRGFDWFNVSVRLAGDADWNDPLDVPEGHVAEPERVVLGAGTFAGRTAEVLIDVRAVPHLWLLADGLVVTVAGDLSGDQLVEIAESLAPCGAATGMALLSRATRA